MRILLLVLVILGLCGCGSKEVVESCVYPSYGIVPTEPKDSYDFIDNTLGYQEPIGAESDNSYQESIGNDAELERYENQVVSEEKGTASSMEDMTNQDDNVVQQIAEVANAEDWSTVRYNKTLHVHMSDGQGNDYTWEISPEREDISYVAINRGGVLEELWKHDGIVYANGNKSDAEFPIAFRQLYDALEVFPEYLEGGDYLALHSSDTGYETRISYDVDEVPYTAQFVLNKDFTIRSVRLESKGKVVTFDNIRISDKEITLPYAS